MRATVVVHLQGGPEQALRCFESLAMLPPKPEHEVIVVDDASVGLDELLARLERDVVMPAVPDEHVLAALCLGLDGPAEQIPASALVAPGTRMGAARRAPGEGPELTIVIPTLDASSERVRACITAIHRATPEAPYEIAVIDNGAPPQGFTAPVNSGLRASRGRYAVVMHDDVDVLPGWWPPLRHALDTGASVAFPVTIDGAMRTAFAAWCFAVSREALDRFSVEPGEFFDPRFRVWYQDTDLLTRLRAAGTPPVCVEESHIRHGLSETVASDDPELKAWIAEAVAADPQ